MTKYATKVELWHLGAKINREIGNMAESTSLLADDLGQVKVKADSMDKKLDTLIDEIRKIKTDFNDLKSDISVLKTDVNSVKGDLKELKKAK